MEKNILIEEQDEVLRLIDQKELDEIESSAEEFDGFTGIRIVGRVQPEVMLRIAEIAGAALAQWKLHIEENEQKDIADINHIEANTWKNVDAELKILRSNLST